MVTLDRADAGAPIMVTVLSKDGTTIASWRSGTGPALVLVHGATGDHTAFHGVLTELEPHLTVYAMDRRGRGASGDHPPYALEREAEDIAAIADKIGGPVCVAGHSFGGLCALEAARLTANIASLVVYEPPVIAGDPDELPILDELDELIAQDRRDEATVLFYQRVVGWSPEEIERVRADPSWEGRVASVHTVPRELRAIGPGHHFAWDAFGQFDRPTLLFTGELSPPDMRAGVGALHAVLPNSRMVVLQGQAHAGFRTAPKLVAAEVLQFLRSDVD